MGGIFGGKEKKSAESGNLAYGTINNATGSSLGNIGKAGSLMNAFLSGDSSGFDDYKTMAGYNPAQEAGSRGVTANLAARGALNSGAAGKNYLRVANDISSQFADNYWQKLLGLNQQGLGAGSLLTQAGQYSKEKSHDGGKSGLGNALSMVASAAAMSDPRLKRNIVRIGETPEGIPTYEYEYLWDDTKRIGVMADEVAELKPEALGPVVAGYRSVDYSKLQVLEEV